MNKDISISNFYSSFLKEPHVKEVPIDDSALEEYTLSEDEVKDFLSENLSDDYINPSGDDISQHQSLELVLYPEDSE